MLPEKERIALYYLNSFPGMYPFRLNAMYQYTESFEEALNVSAGEYLEAGVFKRSDKSGAFDRFRRDKNAYDAAAASYGLLAEKQIRMIDFTEADMPARLKLIQDPPAVLFIKGRLPADDRPSVSIIGSRNASSYGMDVAAFMGRELGKAGVQIISGMAAGIDSSAQSGSLEATDDTFAVLGSGVDFCYPSSSRRIYREMIRRGGVLSEFNPSEPALGYHFVIRNRIIAGLCDALLVIEAAEKSGTSITVEDALTQGKDIFALPGRITDPLGLGCNRLIRDGAMILTSPSDVLKFFGLEGSETDKRMMPFAHEALSEAEKKIRSFLGPDPMHVELISEQSGIALPEVIGLLNSMEVKGAVRSAGFASYTNVYR